MLKEDIKKLRKSLKLSRHKFGILISNQLGLEKGIYGYTIYRWETGRAKPNQVHEKTLNELANAREKYINSKKEQI